MTPRERWMTLVVTTIVGVSAWWIFSGSTVTIRTAPAVPYPGSQQTTWWSYGFSNQQLKPFLSAAMASEAIPDPLRRCLSFPNPPRSHWSHAAVAAYCRYLFQPIVNQADALKLIHDGHADVLDRRLSDAMHAQQSQPDSRGLLDRTYEVDFYDGSPDVRLAIEAWKRRSPNSVFAYAASGCAYVQAAGNARGSKFADQTPDANFEAMDIQLRLARADLDKAVTLDPNVTTTYSAMILAGLLGSDVAYARHAAARGFSVDPVNYAIFDYLTTLAEPKWYGSQVVMLEIAVQGLFHADKNPLLLLLLPKVAGYAAGFHGCACRYPIDTTAFVKVFDQAGDINTLTSADAAASASKLDTFSVVYLLETLRFDPSNTDMRDDLIIALTDIRELPTALIEGDKAVATTPGKGWPYVARGRVYEQSDNYAHAEQDFKTALSIAPGDPRALALLGQLYVEDTRQWDKGWDVANRMIKAHPDDPTGWILRASIQKQQPRPGEFETAEYIVQHFNNDPRARGAIMMARKIAGHDGQIQ